MTLLNKINLIRSEVLSALLKKSFIFIIINIVTWWTILQSRNLVEGMVKGFAKPSTFRLARSNLIPEQVNLIPELKNLFSWTSNPHTTTGKPYTRTGYLTSYYTRTRKPSTRTGNLIPELMNLILEQVNWGFIRISPIFSLLWTLKLYIVLHKNCYCGVLILKYRNNFVICLSWKLWKVVKHKYLDAL